MEFEEMDQRAREYAESVAPRPRHEPFNAGISGTFGTTIVIGVFLLFAGLDNEDFIQAVSVTAVLGFVLPFAYFESQKRAYYRAYEEEFGRLRDGA